MSFLTRAHCSVFLMHNNKEAVFFIIDRLFVCALLNIM